MGIGFGIITSTNRVGVEVRDSRILGAAIGYDWAAAGWMQHHSVFLDPEKASNVVVSIKRNPLRLEVKNFDPFATNTSHNYE